MADYKEFLDSINREAYHAGEYQWEEDGYTVTRTYHYSPPGCHSSCGLLYYVKDGKVGVCRGRPAGSVRERSFMHALPEPRRGHQPP